MKNKNNKLLRFYKNLSIKRKILLVFYIQIIIPLILIGFMSYRISADIIYKKSIAYTQDILNTIELRLKDYVSNLTVVSQDLLYDRKVYDSLNDNITAYKPLNAYEIETEINNTLKKIVFSREEIQSICLISRDGYYYTADNNSRKISIRDSISNIRQDIHDRAREGKGKGVWYLDTKGKGAENVYFARTIYNRDNFSEIGLMVILVKKEFLETVYQDLITSDIQNIAVMSSNNECIVNRNPLNNNLINEELQQKIVDNRGSLIDRENNVLFSYVSMKDPSWRVVTYISLPQLYKEINMLRQWIILLSVISVVILSTLGLYIAVDFINPINRLVKGMKKVQKGEGIVGIEIDRGDELGFLHKTFNEMAKEINHLVNWIYREQITRKEAEIKALQSQINPHFLFNTLESINWMAQLNNVPEISNTVTALSSLMEASIGRDDRLISIEEEFTYIDNYIVILKNRFEDRITLEKNVQQEVLNVKIPRLLIQPLIENAVYHGVERSRDKGIIRLNATLKDGEVFIEVLDNGMGIEKDELEMLNDKLSMDNDTYFRSLERTKRKSIGIENVNRRIKLFYGEKYGLKLESQPGEYTKVIVNIPFEKPETGGKQYV
ncbi:MAG: sensor histidine kinase [Clostridia bacterium]|nr:sensor histidine kinase [Clostridia bacterium]